MAQTDDKLVDSKEETMNFTGPCSGISFVSLEETISANCIRPLIKVFQVERRTDPSLNDFHMRFSCLLCNYPPLQQGYVLRSHHGNDQLIGMELQFQGLGRDNKFGLMTMNKKHTIQRIYMVLNEVLSLKLQYKLQCITFHQYSDKPQQKIEWLEQVNHKLYFQNGKLHNDIWCGICEQGMVGKCKCKYCTECGDILCECGICENENCEDDCDMIQDAMTWNKHDWVHVDYNGAAYKHQWWNYVAYDHNDILNDIWHKTSPEICQSSSAKLLTGSDEIKQIMRIHINKLCKTMKITLATCLLQLIINYYFGMFIFVYTI